MKHLFSKMVGCTVTVGTSHAQFFNHELYRTVHKVMLFSCVFLSIGYRCILNTECVNFVYHNVCLNDGTAKMALDLF